MCGEVLVIQGNVTISHTEPAGRKWSPHTLGARAGEAISHHDTAGVGGLLWCLLSSRQGVIII